MSVTKRDAVELGYSIRDLVPDPVRAVFVPSVRPEDVARICLPTARLADTTAAERVAMAEAARTRIAAIDREHGVITTDTDLPLKVGDTFTVPAPKPAIFRDPGYLVWLRYQRCRICTRLKLRQETSSDPAHTPKTRIHGDSAISLCRQHHEEEERLQPEAFAATYKLDLDAEFRAQYAEYQRELKECAF